MLNFDELNPDVETFIREEVYDVIRGIIAANQKAWNRFSKDNPKDEYWCGGRSALEMLSRELASVVSPKFLQ